MTVSRVFNADGYVAEEASARVRAAFGQLQYHPNAAVGLAAGGQSELVGVTIRSQTSPVHRGIVDALEPPNPPATDTD